MRYAPKEWKGVAILMRDSSYRVMEALISGKDSWSEIRDYAKLTDGGLQKILKELIKTNIVEERLQKTESGIKAKRYYLSKKAEKEKIYEKSKELKESLERLK
jgi:predicted transcriptional regulator